MSKLWTTFKERWPNFCDQKSKGFLYTYIEWCFNNPNDPVLKFIDEAGIKTPLGAEGIYLSHQCKYMGPIQNSIIKTMDEVVDILEIPKNKDDNRKMMKSLIKYSLQIFFRYWHNYMLAYTRLALIMVSTRAEFFAGNITRDMAFGKLRSFGITDSEANALLEKDYEPTSKRFEFPSQKDMLNSL